MSQNPYGRFDDAAREYVITRPDTPLPWLNYLGQDEFFGLCTNTAGGYTFWKDAKLRRLTRYRYNNVPYDLGGRYLYVNDAGSVWNPGWKPVKAKLDKYECRHGLGYTTIVAEKDGLEITQKMCVPPGENLELWQVTVRNTGKVAKSPKLYSYQEFCFFEALNDMTNYQRTYSIGEVEIEGNAIYHKTEYRERRNHYTLFACTRDISGFDTSRDVFVGIHEGLHEAKVPFSGKATNTKAFGWNPIGSHEVSLELQPGQSETFAFILAYVDHTLVGFKGEKFDAPYVINKTVGKAIVEKYSKPGAVEAAFASLKAYWDENLGNFQVESPDPHATRMANTWNQYQCMATFNMSRSASMYETGIGRGMGFRDSNQDLLGFVHMIHGRARERILDIAATQLSDGTCYHQYQPLTKKGNAEVGGDFYDDHLWLVLSTVSYIKESGDKSILDAPCGYADKKYGSDGEKETLLHHLETSIAYTMKMRGPQGLPLIGHADWNDCLNLNCHSTEPNESFQTAGDVGGSKAESVMIAGLFLYAARELSSLYTFLGRQADADRIAANRKTMMDIVESVTWDGEWYTRAYDFQGKVIGSKSNEEGKIFIESQGWCVLGGAGADNGRARLAMESVHKHLYTKNGIVLQQPAYSTYHSEYGEVTSYPPGVKENAGIFSHNNTWIHLGWCLLGEGDRAMEYYHSICPSKKEEQIDTYRSEPYVYAQMTAGKDAPCFGEAKNSWLTGTAAWTFVVVSQGIFGIKPDFAGLMVDPCIPKGWPGFKATRKFRGATYQIEVKNPKGVCKGVVKATVDGKEVAGNILPLLPKGSVAQVVIELG
ncbi:MAG: glycosyl transferase [Fibrobacteres bacterium]|nr:glycosyl transferase [Fibrobacterota bacterium]